MSPRASIERISTGPPQPLWNERRVLLRCRLCTHIRVMLSAFVRRLVLVDVLFDVNTSDGIVDAVLDVAEVTHFQPWS